MLIGYLFISLLIFFIFFNLDPLEQKFCSATAGNLVLTNGTHIFWQSFDHPTDTLLPGMKIKAGKTGWPLTSWQSDTDPAPGLFSLQYLGSRKELVLTKGSQQYWSSPVLSDRLADIFVIDGDYLTWPSTNDIRRIRLDIYGNLLLQ
jgi:hypothetical protein